MYGSPLYMVAYGAPNAPTLPSGKKYPILQKGDTDASIQSSSGISGLVSWIAHVLHDELNGLNPNKNSRDPVVLVEDNPLFVDSKVTSKLSVAQQGQLVAFITEYNPNAGGKMPTFGDQLDAAVRAFQAYKGLSVDGKMGKQTWAALGYEGINNKSGSTSSGAPATGSSPMPASEGFSVKKHWAVHQDKYWIGISIGIIGAAIFIATRGR